MDCQFTKLIFHLVNYLEIGARRVSHFRWLSVSVMPCEDTLKCTMVAAGGEAADSVSEMALATAWGPVSDSISTEFRYSTLHAGKKSPNVMSENRLLYKHIHRAGTLTCSCKYVVINMPFDKQLR